MITWFQQLLNAMRHSETLYLAFWKMKEIICKWSIHITSLNYINLLLEDLAIYKFIDNSKPLFFHFLVQPIILALMSVLFFLFIRILEEICRQIDSSIKDKKLLSNFKMSELPQLSEKLEKFLKLLVLFSVYVHIVFPCCKFMVASKLIDSLNSYSCTTFVRKLTASWRGKNIWSSNNQCPTGYYGDNHTGYHGHWKSVSSESHLCMQM